VSEALIENRFLYFLRPTWPTQRRFVSGVGDMSKHYILSVRSDKSLSFNSHLESMLSLCRSSLLLLLESDLTYKLVVQFTHDNFTFDSATCSSVLGL
jgi:hypothetical protein